MSDYCYNAVFTSLYWDLCSWTLIHIQNILYLQLSSTTRVPLQGGCHDAKARSFFKLHWIFVFFYSINPLPTLCFISYCTYRSTLLSHTLHGLPLVYSVRYVNLYSVILLKVISHWRAFFRKLPYCIIAPFHPS